MAANLKMTGRRKIREMNAAGIDVSIGKSTVAIMRPFGKVVAEPFEVSHTDAELRNQAYFWVGFAAKFWHCECVCETLRKYL